MGPIGGRMKIHTDTNQVRVSQVLSGSPGEAAGLQVNDYIYGAFGRQFEVHGSDYKGKGGVFTGCIRQFGNAIDRAERGDGSLPLMVLRPGTGTMTITVSLDPVGSLTPAHPLTSAKYAQAYEQACSQLHQRIMDDNDGDVGYLTGFVGLSLLGHPNWNDTAGDKPFRLSLDKIKDDAVARINAAWYAPFESLLLDLYEADGTTPKQPSDNPNPIPAHESIKNWDLGGLGMFLAEYYAKTEQAGVADPLVFAALQRAAELSANRIQNWKQPPGTNPWGRNPSYESRRGQTGHSNVTGDYMHYDFGGGINMTGVHLFGALALAKRAGVDMAVRPKDGKDFGYGLSAGDPVPAEIADALPDRVDFPRNGEDAGGYGHVSKTATDPADPSELVADPFYYDWDLRQKFWLKWEFLRRSSSSAGYVNYAAGAGAQYDACGRTAGALFGLMAFTDGVPPTPEDLEQANKQKDYLARYHDISLNAHTYNSGGALFYALAAPYLDDQQQRFYLHNWRFRSNFMREHDGSLSYMGGREYEDSYVSTSLAKWVHLALPRSVATGGLPHVAAYDTQRIFAQFQMPDLRWDKLEARSLTRTDSLEVNLDAALIDASGNHIDPVSATVSWSVLSGPSTSGILADPSSLVTTATFPQAGNYRLQLQASHGGLSTTELIDVAVSSYILPDGWQQGKMNYEIYELTDPGSMADLTSHPNFPDAPDIATTLTTTIDDYGGSDYGSRMSGYLLPPLSGTYSLYVAGNDRAELHLNATASSGDQVADRAGLALVASARSTDPQEWDNSVEQRHDVVLEAGKLYYFEALQVENSGSDHLAVGWTPPGGSEIVPIPSLSLAIAGTPQPTTASIVSQPVDQTVALGDTASFSLVTEGPEPASYQWRRNGVNIGPATSSPTLSLPNAGGALEGVYDCVYTTPDQVLVSDPASLSFSDPGYGTVLSGGLWEEEFYNLSGDMVVDLTAADKFPLLADSSRVITAMENITPADDAGRRWSGWIVPEETADYRFFLASNNSSELWLSPDEYEGHKRVVGQINGKSNARAWEDVTPSEWFTLTAGQRYYIEVLHKNNEDSDHVAVTWQKSGDPDPVNGAAPIPSNFLRYRFGGYYNDTTPVAPIAVDDNVMVEENGLGQIPVLGNDLDNEASTLTVISFTQPTSGTVSLQNGVFSYRPDRDFFGSDSFTYSMSNTDGLSSNIATVHISVTETSATLPIVERQTLATSFRGHEIHDGSQFINGWREYGTASSTVETLNGNILNISHPDGVSAGFDGKYASKDGGASTWNSGNDEAWTFETRLRFNANPHGFRLRLGTDDNNIYVDLYADRTQSASGEFVSEHNNLDGAYHVWRVAHDVARGSYHAWRDGERLTPPAGVAYDSTSGSGKLVLGDTTSGSFGNLYNVDIDYVCYDQSGTYLPAGSDADQDGLFDSWELQHFGHTTIASAEADDDGDGKTNLEEFQSGTNPFDQSSWLRISSIAEVSEGNWQITVPESSSSRIYTLYQSNDLGISETWTPVSGQIDLPGTDGPMTFSFSSSVGMFYRVAVSHPK